ncbi:AsmA family protein [Wenzhouxiangella sp. AB-CW3]|uniref:AsmA family protein n=1 Tax=Wenzhouxiangella sp. AB-CW3 TaxID=2771012 RepID=UPI00168AD1F2|nr:AsmA family protein [Wenzhouxiangella sp. AB-CW3]QOC22549.1 AsmA family protein [Wenzhouxiangella sp. AB-CW3]
MLRRIILVLVVLILVIVVAALAAVVLIDPDDYREQIAERASDQIGREVRLDGSIQLRLFPWLAFEIRDASVGNPPGFAEAPPLAEIGVARAAVRVWPLIRGELEIGAIDFEQATFNLVTDRQGASNLEGLFAEDPDPAAADAPREPDLSGLQTGAVGLRSVSVVLLDLAEDTRREIAVESFDMAGFAADSDIDFTLRGRFLDGADVVIEGLEVSGTLRLAANLSAVELDRWRADFNLPAAQARVRAEGDTRVDLSADPMSLVVPRFEVQLDLPDLQAGLALTEPLALTLDDPVRLAVPGAELRLDGQRLDLDAELVLADPLRGRMALRGERLDLRTLAALDGDDPSPAPDNGEATDFSPLTAVDLRVDLNLDELVLAEGLELSQVRAGSHLVDGMLRLDPLEARLFGGGFEGRVEVDFNQDPPAVHLQPRLSGVLIEQMAGLFSDHAPVAGSGDLSLDLSFRGLELRDILASIDGSGQFQLTDGAVHGIDLNQLIEQELTVASLGNVRQAFSGQTPFRSLSGSLRAEDGVINLPDLDLAASGFGARGSGRIDFTADQVDYRIELDLGESLLEQLPSRLRSATGGSIPLAIVGPVTAPVVSVDVAGIAERAVRDELGRRLLDRIDRPREDDEDTEREDSDAQQGRREREEAGRQLLRGLLDTRRDRSADDETDEDEDSDEKNDEDRVERALL